MNGNKYVGSELEIIDLNSNSKCLKEKIILENQQKKKEIEKRVGNNKINRFSSIQKKSSKKFTFSFLKLNK